MGKIHICHTEDPSFIPKMFFSNILIHKLKYKGIKLFTNQLINGGKGYKPINLL